MEENVLKYYKDIFISYSSNEETDFDNEIKIFISKALGDLSINGVLTFEHVNDWNTFTFSFIKSRLLAKVTDEELGVLMEFVKSYIYASIKLSFDTPQYNSLKYFEELQSSSKFYLKNYTELNRGDK